MIPVSDICWVGENGDGEGELYKGGSGEQTGPGCVAVGPPTETDKLWVQATLRLLRIWQNRYMRIPIATGVIRLGSFCSLCLS